MLSTTLHVSDGASDAPKSLTMAPMSLRLQREAVAERLAAAT